MSDLEFYVSYGSIGILIVAFFLVALIVWIVILGELDLRRIDKIGRDIVRQAKELRAKTEKQVKKETEKESNT